MVVTTASVLTRHPPSSATTNLPAAPAGSTPGSPQTGPAHLRLGQPARRGHLPTVCDGLLAPFLRHHPTSVPNTEARGPFDHGSGSCHRFAPSKDLGMAGRPCVMDASQLRPSPLSPASDPSRPPLRASAPAAPSPQTSTWLPLSPLRPLLRCHLCRGARPPPWPSASHCPDFSRRSTRRPLPALVVIFICLPALSSKGQERGVPCVDASGSPAVGLGLPPSGPSVTETVTAALTC